MKKNQHYHWPKPYNPKDWNPPPKNLIPFMSCICRLKKCRRDENPYLKTKAPPALYTHKHTPSKRLMSTGFKHMVITCRLHSSWQSLLWMNITAMKAAGRQAGLSHTTYNHMGINTSFQKCPQIVPPLSARATRHSALMLVRCGQRPDYII